MTITCTFEKHPRQQAAEVTIWFRNASGGNSWTNKTITWPESNTANGFLNAIIAACTDFVRANWFLVEVTTPTTINYGRHEGGHNVGKWVRS